MTREEAMAKWGKCELRFRYYYKFAFSFEGVSDDKENIIACVGGDSDEIYRFSVDAKAGYCLANLPYSSVTVTKDQQKIWIDTRD